MKKFILGAVALMSLTHQAVAQTPTAPSSTPVVLPAPPTPPASPVPPSQPTNQKEKGDKHKGDHDENKSGERKEERAWENHRKDKRGNRGQERKAENEARKEERGNRGQERKAENEVRKEERGNRGQERKAENEVRKEERGNRGQERKVENEARKEARSEKLDRMKAYLNLTADQESRVSAAIQSFRAGAKATKADAKLTPEQKKTQLEKLAAERNAQLKAILTPEQLAKLAEAQKQGLGKGNKGRNGFMSDEWGDDD
jgi:hypothetical protein